MVLLYLKIIKANMPIRLIKESDEEQILALDYLIFGNIDGGWTHEDFITYFSPGTCFAYYDEEKPDEIMGYIFSKPYSMRSHVSNIGVKKEYEGHGIGKELMKAAMLKEEEQAKKRPFSIRLQVRTDNQRALNFYQNLGYIEYNRTAGWIHMEAKTLPPQFKEKQSRPATTTSKEAEEIKISTAKTKHSFFVTTDSQPKVTSSETKCPVPAKTDEAMNVTKSEVKHSRPPRRVEQFKTIEAKAKHHAPAKTNEQIKALDSETNYFFSLQCLASLSTIAIGGALVAIGIIFSLYPLAAIGVGIFACGVVGLSYPLLFSRNEQKQCNEHPLERNFYPI